MPNIIELSRSNEPRLNLFEAFGPSVFFVFLVSGVFKWIPLPFDLTVGCALFLALCILQSLLMRRVKITPVVAVLCIIMFLQLAWWVSTLYYTSSDYFWIRKLQALFLNTLGFLYPVLAFRCEKQIQIFLKTAVAVSIFGTLIVLTFYSLNLLDFLIYQGYDKETTRIPDYLSIANAVAIGGLVLFTRKSLVGSVFLMASFAALILLGGRGPLLFFTVAALFWIIVRIDTAKEMVKSFAFIAGSIGVILIFMISWSGAENTVRRFVSIFSSSRAFNTSFRIDEFERAVDIIGQFHFLGAGLGSFGVEAYGEDTDIYPHNLFLEAYAEAGLIGIILFSLPLIIVFLISAIRTKQKSIMLLTTLILFSILNYMKSGGFIGARDLYGLLGVFFLQVGNHEAHKKAHRNRI